MLRHRQHSRSAQGKPSVLRMRVWLHSLELDKQLAAGVDPASSAELELRTLQLCTAKTRQMLSRSVRRLIDDSAQPWPSAAITLRIRPTALAVARDALVDLANTLEDPRANAVTGVAHASWLISDGSGPLYTTPGVQLEREIGTAVDDLWGEA